MRKPTIFLADDHAMVVDAFRRLLEQEFNVVGTASDGLELLHSAPKLHPDLVIVDLGLPFLSGVHAGRELKKLLPQTKILVVTVNEDPAVADAVLSEWASGYLVKKCSGSELVKALRELLMGRPYVTTMLSRKSPDNLLPRPPAQVRKSLTPRQRQVLQLLAEGRTMKEAAYLLNLTARTVAFHKYKIMSGLGMHSNSELLKLAIRENLIPMA
jgi:DNA-binding NarL/FixJ family response regulator